MSELAYRKDVDAEAAKEFPLTAVGEVLETHERRDLHRGLSQRHVSMLALAGGSDSIVLMQGQLELACFCPWAAPSQREGH